MPKVPASVKLVGVSNMREALQEAYKLDNEEEEEEESENEEDAEEQGDQQEEQSSGEDERIQEAP
jgi:hypothetical protein